MPGSSIKECPLCETVGGLLVFQNAQLRVIQASEAGFPAFYRVVWARHVAEFSDLSPSEREICMHAVVTVEQVLRAQLQTDKINLAALGNVVPHVHWHVVARFAWDTHFPAPVWAAALRPQNDQKIQRVAACCPEINRLIAGRLS